jgi:hypothetical protein
VRHILAAFGAALVACGHSDPRVEVHPRPEAAGAESDEMSDPVRRERAVREVDRRYRDALATTTDRSAESVHSVVNENIEWLTTAYVEHPDEPEIGLVILELLATMRDARALAAFERALAFRVDATEDHAIRAARALREIEVPHARKGAIIASLAETFERIRDARGVDNRMRIEIVHTLGRLDDHRATPILSRIATTRTETQHFLINRLALEQLGGLGDPAALPALLDGLFLFSMQNPAQRMNDTASVALVHIGRPSYEPLLALLRGENASSAAIVDAYIEAVRARSAEVAASMTREALIAQEVSFVLGALGYRDALPILLSETQSADLSRRIAGALALVRLNVAPSDMADIRDALTAVYRDAPVEVKSQLLAAMRHTYDPGLEPFFLRCARDRDLHIAVRLEAATAHALLASAADVASFRTFVRREPSLEAGGIRERLQDLEPLLVAATECGDGVACWMGKLADPNAAVIEKACSMLGRYAREDEGAITALTGLFDHDDISVRLAALFALDHIATRGAPAAVQRIDALRESEEGRSIWSNFSREALPVRARLSNRAR